VTDDLIVELIAEIRALREAIERSLGAVVRVARFDPHASEVAALWATCIPVTDDDGVADYLTGRSIDPVAVADLDLAALVASDAALPSWAKLGHRSWLELGARLIVPLVDELGAMRSLIARRIDDAQPKSLAAKGYQRAGLVMACPMARHLLERGPDIAEGELRIDIAEGEIDFLTRASGWSDANELPPATLAMVQGSMSAAHAARIPKGCVVFAVTDPDPAGAKHATKIMRAYERRIAAEEIRFLLRPEHAIGRDDNDRPIVTMRKTKT